MDELRLLGRLRRARQARRDGHVLGVGPRMTPMVPPVAIYVWISVGNLSHDCLLVWLGMRVYLRNQSIHPVWSYASYTVAPRRGNFHWK